MISDFFFSLFHRLVALESFGSHGVTNWFSDDGLLESSDLFFFFFFTHCFVFCYLIFLFPLKKCWIFLKEEQMTVIKRTETVVIGFVLKLFAEV